MKRETCGNCAWSDLDQILDLGTSPVANTFPTTPDAKLSRYPLGLVRCRRCDLVQISELVPDKVLWEADYAFYSSTSPMLRAHHEEYARWLWAEYPDQMAAGTLVEVGCNDGSLLQHLANSPRRPTVGIDPAYGPTQAARDSEWAHRYGAEIITRPFGIAAATDLATAFGQAHVVVANNVAAHVANLDDFIGGIRELLHPDGVAIIEVQYLPDLLLGNDVTMVYHEHRYFYSLASLQDCLTRRGLTILRVWHNDMQGGTIRVEVRHKPRHPHEAALFDGPMSRAEHLAEVGLGGLQARADRVRDRLLDLLDDERQQRRVIFGYGASAKAVTLANWLGLSTNDVRGWLDTTPAKIGRYLPGTNIPIVDRAHGAMTYLLTVVNYLSRVLRQEATWLDHPGSRIIIPIPVPRIL